MRFATETYRVSTDSREGDGAISWDVNRHRRGPRAQAIAG
jgi:hypothetical protein